MPRDRWGQGADRSADVTLHLKGRGVAPTADAQRNIVWVMSHPSELAPGELDAADLVLAGSELLADRYRAATTTPVATLPQAADARGFTSGAADPERASRVLFVGNTRSVERPVVLGAVDAGLPLTLVGAGWERYLDPRLVTREHVPYAELPGWYRSADVVLNDHWDDMARWGLVSNRVFDALACGACVVSDEVPGLGALLDDAVVTFRDRADVGPVVRALLADPDARAARAERGRRAVLAAHTWAHRAETLVRLVTEQP
jgi:spore maturation protein CgeB